MLGGDALDLHGRPGHDRAGVLGDELDRPVPPGRAQEALDVRLGHAFNQHIENAIYRHPLRQAFGMPTATIVYTVFAFFMNALYLRRATAYGGRSRVTTLAAATTAPSPIFTPGSTSAE